MGGRGGGQRRLDGFGGKEGRKEGWLGQTGGRWDDAIVMRLCRPASLGFFSAVTDGPAGRRSEKCSLKMLIARVAFWRRRAFLCLPAL